MKTLSILLILCILCISITQNAQAIDIVIPDGKDGKYYCNQDEGYQIVLNDQENLESEGYEVHLTIEETNCWLTYILQKSKDGKTSSSRYNLSKGTSGCGEIYAKAGCGTNTKRETEKVCGGAGVVLGMAESHISDCIQGEAEFVKKTGGSPGTCKVESAMVGQCEEWSHVVARGRWTQGGGTWDPVTYYSAGSPVCGKGCNPALAVAFGCEPCPASEEESTTTTTLPGSSGGGSTQGGGNKKCSAIEAINAAKGASGGVIQTTGDGKCWDYAIGDKGTFLSPKSDKIGDPQSECCPAYGMAGCVGYCEIEGQAVYNFNSGGGIPEKEECSVCDYMKKLEENKLDPEKFAKEITKQIFSDENTKPNEDGSSKWSKVGEQLINEKMREEIADEIADELFDTESLETFRDVALKPSEGTQQVLDQLTEEVKIQSDIDFTVENIKTEYANNVEITEDESKTFEANFKKVLLSAFNDTKIYMDASPVFSLLKTKQIESSGECKFQIPSPIGWLTNETAYIDVDFCQWKPQLVQIGFALKFFTAIIAVLIILG